MAYFSNGTEGSILDEQCAVCPIGSDPDAPCPVLLVQLHYNYKQLKEGNKQLRKAMNLLINKEGICQMRKVMLEYGPKDGKFRPEDDPELFYNEPLQRPV